ncbi:MAG TPA: AbrB/MazE/SpoVT family DNA-binding domain-containing protein [Dehalococcoidia bacterium]|nr:AbrB/MazE/SpoVT family DNA-binding domain-containing protein [Dehalococcoidia bacterium]
MKRSRAEQAELTLSSKRQITLPAAMVKKLGLEPGDRIAAGLADGTIVLKPRTSDWLERITRPRRPIWGKTKDEIDAYIAEVREGWENRLSELERVRRPRR